MIYGLKIIGEDMINKAHIFLFLIILSKLSFAEVVSIPLVYTASPANDLVDDSGRALKFGDLQQIWKNGGDLSKLNPRETDIWQNSKILNLDPAEDEYNIDTSAPLNYVDKVISTIGSFRFVVRESNNRAQRNFNIWLSKDSRSILLRKNLLRKLGYKIPAIEHYQNIKIKFQGKISLDHFISELKISTFADVDRWRVEQDENEFVLTLQDVLVFESNTKIYNFAMGELNDEVIAHRRVVNALSIFYALVDVRESVDGLSWSLGKIDNKVLLLDIISGDAFSTTFYDTKWALNKLAQLSRSDIEEIVELSYFPKSVGMLLVEKLISRINSIQTLINSKYKKLPVNFEITDSEGELKRGRLLKDNWEGHASRYSYDDTESPLSRDELSAYFKSKFYSGVIENLVSYVNDNYLYETDIQKAAIEKAIEAKKKQFLDLFETGEFKKVPFSAWVIPTAKGHIAASRDIITGAYLGTDNLIQIADSIEFIGEVGAFVGTLGLPVEVQAYATGSARFSRSYSHVKSIKSIKKALKEPFRNIIVPSAKRKKAGSIINIIDSLKSEDFSKLEGDERKEELGKILKELDGVMEIGDSLIISNNLILGGALTVGYQLPVEAADVEALIQFNTRKVNIWRLHILRADENTFQVYRSKANSFGRGGGFQLKAYVPIISLNFDRQSGSIKTEFHSVSLSNEASNDVLIENLTKLRQVFVENSTELIAQDNKPFIIEHNFSEKSSGSRFFQYQKNSVNVLDKMKITHPEQYEAELYVRSVAELKGKNYIQVAYDALNSIISEVLDNDDINFSNAESGNPGDSFYGESYSRQVLTEVPFNHLEQEIPFEDYSQVKSQWKGWKANKYKLKEIRDEITEKYGTDIFSDEMFSDTEQIQLYTVEVTLSLYQRGLSYIINTDHSDFMEFIERELVLPWPKNRSHWQRFGKQRINKYERDRKRAIRKIEQAHRNLNAEYSQVLRPDQKSLDLTLLVDSLENLLSFDNFTRVVGGDENFYLKGSVNGFRVGTENGEEAIISNAIGEYGSEMPGGIIDTLKRAIKISQGELGAYWFLRRIQ